MAQKLKRILLAGLLILIPIIVDVILKNRGVTLGAIPTVILYGPFLAFAGKVFHGESSFLTRSFREWNQTQAAAVSSA